jgi:mannose-6-phosphate isomerase-like protein (cupin superfamily)
MNPPPIRRFQDYRWQAVDLLAYKQEGAAPFKDITRQILFQSEDLDGELRYFEMAPGGHSTLERHQHRHAVMILRGHGHCLVGETVYEVGPNDLVEIGPMTWHQFKASQGEPLGFLCLVNVRRDKPQLPSESELQELQKRPDIAAFLSGR